MQQWRFYKSGVSQDQSSSRLAMDRVQTVCKASFQVASGLFPFLRVLAFPHVVLEAAGRVVVAVKQILYEIRRRSRAMSHELGVNAVQLFT